MKSAKGITPESAELLAGIAAEGVLDSRGAFTLDRQKAREKLRSYQLPDPHWFVLQLVSAAHAGGATRVAVTVDVDDVIVEFDGPPLSKEIMEDPFSCLFISQERQSMERERDIAVGINSALSLFPRRITMESGSSGLLITGSEEKPYTLEAPVAGVRIHVRSRTSPHTVRRFIKGLFSSLPEAFLVSEKCRWSQIPVTVNGKGVNTKPSFPDALTCLEWTSPEGGERGYRARGVFAIPRAEESGWALSIVKHGVHLAERTIPGRTPPLAGVVHADFLLRTASASDLVEDARYDRLLKIVGEAADAALSDLGGRVGTLSGDALRKKAISIFLNEAPRLIRRSVPDAWWSVPMFPAASGGKPFTLSDLSEAKYVAWSDRRWSVPHPDGIPLLLVEDMRVREALKAVPGKTVVNGQKVMEAAQKREDNRRLWKSRKILVRLLPGDYLERMKFSVETTSGEMGVPAVAAGKSLLLLHSEGRFLVERRLPLSCFIHCAVNDDALTPSFTWDDVEVNDAYRLVLGRLETEAINLYGKIAGRMTAQDPNFAVMRARLLDLLQTPAGLGKLNLPAFRETPLFPTVAGAWVSLATLDKERAHFKTIRYITQPSPGPQADSRHIVVAAQPELKILRSAFPDNLIVWDKGLRDERARLENLQRARVEAVLSAPVICSVKLEGDGPRGEVGIPVDIVPGRNVTPPSKVHLLKEGRHLAERKLQLSWGPVIAVVNDDRLTPNDRWDDVVENEAYACVINSVEKAFPALARSAAKALLSLDEASADRARRLLIAFARRAMPDWEKPSPDFEELRNAALFKNINGFGVSLADIAEEISRTGRVAYVRGAPVRGAKHPRPVLALSDFEWDQVRKIVGESRLRDAKEEIQDLLERIAFEAQPVEEATLANVDCLVRITIDEGGIAGEMGVPVEEAEKGLSFVRLLAQRRYLADWRGSLGLPVAGVLTCDGLALAKGKSLGSGAQRDLRFLEGNEALKKVDDLITAMPGRLVRSLIELLPSLERARRAVAAEHLCLFLARQNITTNALGKAEPQSVRGLLASAPILEDSTGAAFPLSEIIRQYSRLGFLPFTESLEIGALRDRTVRVVRLSRRMRTTLQSLFPRMRDYEKDIALDREAERTLAKKQRVNSLELPPGEYIARRKIRAEGVEGEIGLAERYAAKAGITLAYGGLAIITKPLVEGLSIHGILGGDLEISRIFDDAGLRAAQQRAILPEIGALYREVAGKDEKSMTESLRRHLMDYVIFLKDDLLKAARGGKSDGSETWLDLQLFRLADGAPVRICRLIEELLQKGVLLFTGERFPLPDGSLVILIEKDWELQALRRFAPDGVTACKGRGPEKKTPFYKVDLVEALDTAVTGAIVKIVDSLPEVEKKKPPLEVRPQKKPVRKEGARRDPLAREKGDLLERIRSEFRLMRKSGNPKVGDAILDRLSFAVLDGSAIAEYDAPSRTVRLNDRHFLLGRILRRFEEEPSLVPVVMSAVYSAINRALLDVEDVHEISFQTDLARIAASRTGKDAGEPV
jgi:hypothetical protein